jgi:hypothetical protein
MLATDLPYYLQKELKEYYNEYWVAKPVSAIKRKWHQLFCNTQKFRRDDGSFIK